MEKNYVAPSIKKTAFHCPHCGTKAPQSWYVVYAQTVDSDVSVPSLNTVQGTIDLINRINQNANDVLDPEEEEKWLRESRLHEAGDLVFCALDSYRNVNYKLDNVFVSVCEEVSCNKAALWIHDKIIYPPKLVEEEPNDDMPDHIKTIYNEARAIHSSSPRAASALLRLCCEALCKHLNAKGEKLNSQIADLVTSGLDPQVQRALDIVRVSGNKAVHPGHIELTDDLSTSHTLFLLVNEIVQEMISKKKRINKLYEEKIPQNIREQIAQRDKSSD